MANVVSAKTARLEARVTPELKSLIERAAAYEGRTLSDFLVHTAQEAARAVIEDRETLRLNARESVAFVEALLQPQGPNEALRQAAAEYHRSVISR